MVNFFKRKLLYQVAIAILLSSVILSLLVGIAIIYNSSMYLTEEVENKYYYLVNNYSNQINLRIKEAEVLVSKLDVHLVSEEGIDKIFESEEVKNKILLEMEENFAVLSSYQDSTYDLFLYLQSPDRVEEIIITSLEESDTETIEEIQTICSNAVIGEDYDSRGFWMDYNNDMLISYLKPIFINNELIGFVGARHRKYEFLWGMTDVEEFTKGDTILYDKNYNVFVLNHSLPGKLDTDIESLLPKLKEERSGIIEYDSANRGKLFIAHSKLSNGWLIVIQMSRSDVFVKVNELTKLLFSFVIVGSFMSLIISFLVSRRITNPISKLDTDIRRIASGDYDTELSYEFMKYSNEIGGLASTIETMRSNLSSNIKEIENNSKNLESKVEERTEQLQKTNEYLETSLAELEERKAEMFLINDELEQSLENLRGTQEQLIESRKLSAMSDLVNGVAHQLNTPIGVSITAISYLKKEINDFYKILDSSGFINEDIEEELEELAEIIELTMKNLSKARDTLDAFKYITSDSATEKMVNLELGEFLKDLTSALMVKAEYVKYRLTFKCDNEIMTKSYPSVLTQIMTNLISNTVLHGFKNRENGNIEIKLEEDERYIIINYKDDGVGIAESDLERIFDPFFTTEYSKERIGLGLSIVYNYITVKLEGRIRCESEIGVGTKFVIQIPK